MSSKSSWTTSKTIFEALSALGACQVATIGGVVLKKPTICDVIWEYLGEFLLFLCEILSSSCGKYQKFDYECSSNPGNEPQSPNFCRFS